MESPPRYEFIEATKRVTRPDMIQVWEESEAYQEYVGFIMAIGEAIKGKKIRDQVSMSEVCQRLVSLIDNLTSWVEEIPPVEMSSRYGNPSYRVWFDRLSAQCPALLSSLLPSHLSGAVVELAPYLTDSFGNRTRIDYGTGHEMTFVMFLAALFKTGALPDSDRPAVGLTVFSRYMDLSRLLQERYRMEPAGSQGVWSLDDYQFVAFIWGAAQLVDHPRLRPKAIPDPEMAEGLRRDQHLFSCLAYIHRVKTGPFSEHSNQLWNISAVQQWAKVYTGLIKMYRAEVLAKFPVIQHALFGSVFTLEKATSHIEMPTPGQAPGGPRTAVPGGDPAMAGRLPPDSETR